MTRKRFIKLLMSEGISRNTAAEMAKQAGPNKSFADLYYPGPSRWDWLSSEIQYGIDYLTDLMRNTSISMYDIAVACRALGQAMQF